MYLYKCVIQIIHIQYAENVMGIYIKNHYIIDIRYIVINIHLHIHATYIYTHIYTYIYTVNMYGRNI